MNMWGKNKKEDNNIKNFTVGEDRHYDLYLAEFDCEGSIAHAKMLSKTGFLSTAELKEIVEVLQEIKKDAKARNFKIENDFEDIHSKIESILIEKLGETGKKIHTARSRNDQILTCLNLYFKSEIKSVKKLMIQFFDKLLVLAEKYQSDFMPGYTHLQAAMPSSFGLWFSAYAETLIDDLLLLDTAYKTADQSPLGSAAGFGSSFPIDRNFTKDELKFKYLKVNSLASQISRGKIEKSISFFLSSFGSTISKFCMDICLYMGQDFSFISFPDNLTTGSSIMPHKKNPDLFEIIRAKGMKLQNVNTEISLITSNLPSGYHRDFQIIKKTIIDSIEETKEILDVICSVIPEIKITKNLELNDKYKYTFSVNNLNKKVQEGSSFRDAYIDLKKEINEGNFEPLKNAKYSHIGSIGNLCIYKIKEKMNSLID